MERTIRKPRKVATLRKTRKVITFILLFSTILAIILVGLLNKELYKEMVSIIKDDIYPAILTLLVLLGFVVGGVVKNPPKSFDKFLENGLLQIAVLEMFLFVMGLIILSIYKTGTGTIEVLLESKNKGEQLYALMIYNRDSTRTIDTILVPQTLPDKKPGNYTFRLIEKDYKEEKTISLKAFVKDTVILTAKKNTGTLIVDTEPQGAEIWINDGWFRKLKTPDTLENLERKKINLQLKLKGYLTYEKKEVDLESSPILNLGTITLRRLYRINFYCRFQDIEFKVNNDIYICGQTVWLPEGSYTITMKRGDMSFSPKQINVNQNCIIEIP